MRIGLLTDGYWPGTNGVIRYVSLHKSALETLGHEVYVFTWGTERPDDEPGVIRSPGLPFIKPGYHVALRYSRQAEAILSTLDLLHANQPLLSGMLALRYGKRYGLPVVLTCHSRYDLLGPIYLPFIPPPTYRAIVRRYLRRISDGYSLVIAPTEEAARVIQDLGVRRSIEVIPYGIELDHCRRLRRRLTRMDLGLPDSTPLAIFVGRLAPEKDVHFLLQALARPELAQAYLLILGDGSERPRLEATVRELGLGQRVRFAGEVPPADVPAYIALADLFVTASRIEMMPLSILESLAVGVPVLGPDVSWLRQVIQPEVNGLPIEPEVASFARAWAALLQDEELRARLAHGAQVSSEQYDIRHSVERIVACYEQVLQEHRRKTEKR